MHVKMPSNYYYVRKILQVLAYSSPKYGQNIKLEIESESLEITSKVQVPKTRFPADLGYSDDMSSVVTRTQTRILNPFIYSFSSQNEILSSPYNMLIVNELGLKLFLQQRSKGKKKRFWNHVRK
jgi:hypothetical protein